MNNIKNKVYEILKKDTRLWNNEELNETLLFDLVDKIDTKLIEILLENELTRKKFFIKIKDVYVFNSNDFRFFIEENKLDNSYTKYKNRIGLTDKKRFLKDTNDIVLNFPYKDCILEAGQSTEDGYDYYYEYDKKVTKTDEKNGYKANSYNLKKAKRKEIFFNEVLAKDEIDRLLDEKAFCNFKKYSGGAEELVDFNRDKEINKKRNLPLDTITDNLIIKGNNLLALHSLKKEFAGKIKLIYIDPPYNTGNDSFKYNDNFNHSTWLTFMKNRLEIAKELLSNNGAIFVQCDYNEQAYLKVLMDEIFLKENFLNIISIKSSTPSGVKTSHATKKILKSQDFLLVYKKSELNIKPQYYKKDKWDTHYMFFVENNNLYNLKDILIRKNILSKTDKLDSFDINNPIHKEFYLKYAEQIVRKSTHNNNDIKNICNTKYKNKIYFHDNNMYLNNDMLQPISRSIHEVLNGQRIEQDISNLLCDFWSDIDFQNTQNQGGVSFPAGKKPEQLLYRILNMTTQPNDIVLDFHLGSGTTAAVAHKMNRQYIGIEQMDYIETIAVERLKKVIDGEQGGISKAVNWQGGGSFVYFELAKWNEKAKEEILNKNSLDELIEFFDEMYERYFLNYNLKIKEFKEKVINEEEFKNLSLDRQKEMFITMLDNNQMYINKSEMEDKLYNLSQKDIKLTKKFYKG